MAAMFLICSYITTQVKTGFKFEVLDLVDVIIEQLS